MKVQISYALALHAAKCSIIMTCWAPVARPSLAPIGAADITEALVVPLVKYSPVVWIPAEGEALRVPLALLHGEGETNLC